jgi:uncharacterized membrane protein
MALARMNYLHSLFDISNDDKLYTLSVFTSTPKLWVEKYEWRNFTDLEVAVRNFNSHVDKRHSTSSGGKLAIR